VSVNSSTARCDMSSGHSHCRFPLLLLLLVVAVEVVAAVERAEAEEEAEEEVSPRNSAKLVVSGCAEAAADCFESLEEEKEGVRAGCDGAEGELVLCARPNTTCRSYFITIIHKK
jgi:hypothetical protein